jgi:hypothetical protein
MPPTACLKSRIPECPKCSYHSIPSIVHQQSINSLFSFVLFTVFSIHFPSVQAFFQNFQVGWCNRMTGGAGQTGTPLGVLVWGVTSLLVGVGFGKIPAPVNYSFFQFREFRKNQFGSSVKSRCSIICFTF